MKRESLEALGAVPITLGEARERLPEMIGEMARVAVDNPKTLLLAGCTSYVVSSVILNLVKPRGMLGAMACGIVSVAASGLLMAEANNRGYLQMMIRDSDGNLVPAFPSGDA